MIRDVISQREERPKRFGRRTVQRIFSRASHPDSDTAAIELAESVRLMEHTCRFLLRNEIIVGALRDHQPFSVDHYAVAARGILAQLATDAEAAAIRMIDERGAAELTAGKKRHEHDYRMDDLPNLFRRERMYRALARRLRGAMTDEHRIHALVQDAQSSAWEEVGRAIEGKLSRDGRVPPALDDAERVEQLDQLRSDLAHLHRPQSPEPA